MKEFRGQPEVSLPKKALMQALAAAAVLSFAGGSAEKASGQSTQYGPKSPVVSKKLAPSYEQDVEVDQNVDGVAASDFEIDTLPGEVKSHDVIVKTRPDGDKYIPKLKAAPTQNEPEQTRGKTLSGIEEFWAEYYIEQSIADGAPVPIEPDTDLYWEEKDPIPPDEWCFTDREPSGFPPKLIECEDSEDKDVQIEKRTSSPIVDLGYYFRLDQTGDSIEDIQVEYIPENRIVLKSENTNGVTYHCGASPSELVKIETNKMFQPVAEINYGPLSRERTDIVPVGLTTGFNQGVVTGPAISATSESSGRVGCDQELAQFTQPVTLQDSLGLK